MGFEYTKQSIEVTPYVPVSLCLFVSNYPFLIFFYLDCFKCYILFISSYVRIWDSYRCFIYFTLSNEMTKAF